MHLTSLAFKEERQKKSHVKLHIEKIKTIPLRKETQETCRRVFSGPVRTNLFGLDAMCWRGNVALQHIMEGSEAK